MNGLQHSSRVSVLERLFFRIGIPSGEWSLPLGIHRTEPAPARRSNLQLCRRETALGIYVQSLNAPTRSFTWSAPAGELEGAYIHLVEATV